LAGRLFIFDAADFTTRVLKLSKNPNYQPITELIDYDMFCGLKTENTEGPLSEISVQELAKWKAQNIDFQLVDVREGYEYEAANLCGTLIPLNNLAQNLDIISKEKPVVVHCKSGARSAKAIALLKSHGFTNLINLKGGILAYAKEIDANLTVI
jgi:sulfur-carrier protein adenylyltransferase/sulfurtransferase